jgi:glycosyltransferase involved in cell wall biosynthesis
MRLFPFLLSLSLYLSTTSPIPPSSSRQLFNANKVITIVAFDRIKYFSRVIQALAAADGANEYTILISIDGYDNTHFSGFKYLPNFEKYTNLIDIAKKYQENVELTGFPFKHVEVRIASENLGYAKNKRQALEWGFEKSDYVIFIEDDIVVAPDGISPFLLDSFSSIFSSLPSQPSVGSNLIIRMESFTMMRGWHLSLATAIASLKLWKSMTSLLIS